MLSKPQADLKPNSEAFENKPLVKPTRLHQWLIFKGFAIGF